jgi:SsrA-binding protein
MTENKEKNITVNRKARFEYHIIQTIEAGIELVGTEVKALRQNKANLIDSYAAISGGEVWLVSAHIGAYDHGNRFNHDPLRKRKLLLHRSEIRKLTKSVNEKGVTLIPLRLYFSKGKVKVEIALAKGKKTFDKRRDIADKDAKRDEERKIKL